MNHPPLGRFHVPQVRRIDDKVLKHWVPPAFRRAVQSGRPVLPRVRIPGSGRPTLEVETGVVWRQ
eukprot:7482553-Alexandrium_andersonii.AAC.1